MNWSIGHRHEFLLVNRNTPLTKKKVTSIRYDNNKIMNIF